MVMVAIRLSDRVGTYAAGQLAAQRYVHGLREGTADPSHAPSRVRELQIEHGVESPAIEGFLIELAKRVR